MINIICLNEHDTDSVFITMRYLVHICAAHGVSKYIGIITSHDVFIVKDHFDTRIGK